MRRLADLQLDRTHCIIILAILAALLVLHRPDALLSAQFWAEDGAIWYADAHNSGALHAVFMTQDGYFSTYLRLVAWVSRAVPLLYAPLVFAIIALTLKLLPAAVFLTKRFRHIAPDAIRVAIAFLYVLLPNAAEAHGNATNAQWYLAILACTILLAEPSRTRVWRVFDIAVIALSAVSGPYTLFMLPIAGLLWRNERTRWRLAQFALLTATSALQLWALFIANAGYRTGSLPAFDLLTLARILERQIILGGTLGMYWLGEIGGVVHWYSPLMLAMIVLPAIALCIYALLRSPFALRAFIFFAAVNLGASLAAPNLGQALNNASDYREIAWQAMFSSSSGSRYWIVPVIAWMLVLVWSAGRKRPLAVRLIALIFLAMLPFGILGDYRHRPYTDMHFAEHVAAYESATPGETVTFPLNPPGWEMDLRKQ